MKPTVSVIIPAYNAAATLDRCLESILTQSLQEIEVLCVNDGSTDETRDVLQRWQERDKRVRICTFAENQGLVPALKAGILASTGEYVMFVDADDRLLPGACENAVRLIREHAVDILQFSVKVKALYPGIDESEWQKRFAAKEWSSEGSNILYDCFSMHRFLYYVWNKIYRGEVCRTAAAAMPDLRITFPADVLQTFFFLYFAKTFRSVPDGPYYEYSVGNGISTSSPTAQKFSALCAGSAILPAIEDFLKKENALENNRFLLDAIRIRIQSGALSELLMLPEITRETIELAVKSWGSEVIYDFIKETGLLDVKCKSRYRLVYALADQIRKQNMPPKPGGWGTTLSVCRPQ